MVYFITFLILVGGAVAAWQFSKHQARQKLLSTPLSAYDRGIVARVVPLTQKLPQELHPQLEGKMNIFLQQVEFIGCDGLEVTEEMRLSIAAQACLLVVNTDAWYKNLRTILIYPGAFKSKRQQRDGYIVTEDESVRIGESWNSGPVILSWRHSNHGAQDYDSGHNVVFHEFAHQLDALSGYTDGAPNMTPGQDYADWERVILAAFERHLTAVEQRQETVLDPYGAQSHEEFFAVAVEVFFEQPRALKAEEPEVYAQLAHLFRLHPADWA